MKKFNPNIAGSVRLLRTGATAGTPYSYTIYRVGEKGFSNAFEIQPQLILKSTLTLNSIYDAP